MGSNEDDRISPENRPTPFGAPQATAVAAAPPSLAARPRVCGAPNPVGDNNCMLYQHHTGEHESEAGLWSDSRSVARCMDILTAEKAGDRIPHHVGLACLRQLGHQGSHLAGNGVEWDRAEPEPQREPEPRTWRGIHKLSEEMGELLQVLGKLGAYPEGKHPDGGKPITDRLEEEAADVLAALTYFVRNNALKEHLIKARAFEKNALFQRWGMTGLQAPELEAKVKRMDKVATENDAELRELTSRLEDATLLANGTFLGSYADRIRDIAPLRELYTPGDVYALIRDLDLLHREKGKAAEVKVRDLEAEIGKLRADVSKPSGSVTIRSDQEAIKALLGELHEKDREIETLTTERDSFRRERDALKGLVDILEKERDALRASSYPTPEQWAAAKPVQGSRPIRIEVVARVELVRDLRWK